MHRSTPSKNLTAFTLAESLLNNLVQASNQTSEGIYGACGNRKPHSGLGAQASTPGLRVYLWRWWQSEAARLRGFQPSLRRYLWRWWQSEAAQRFWSSCLQPRPPSVSLALVAIGGRPTRDVIILKKSSRGPCLNDDPCELEEAN